MNVSALNAQMQSRLNVAGLPFESIRVFGAIRCNVHVTCVSRATADKWSQLLAQVFSTTPTITRHVWDAKENHGTCMRPTKRNGWLVGVVS